ncbi:hypothetical protein KIPB_012317 [Kipferlia bialata]|uniref:RecF/RecN/SMC N-terminal domain-containing protein n=1 Tax=Kipferlia bialata TaxID=797122 RepID=A0A391NTE7_9EUKA|nr:hypothetical protein KIPB_012317 [Kipferlia bialata]|eukprot:g12317.t1
MEVDESMGEGPVATQAMGGSERAEAKGRKRHPAHPLVLDHLVLDNFKSYAGRHTVGPFHKHFTSIIGPNGSGKSNTIDSLLFVFGSRSKSLRCVSECGWE